MALFFGGVWASEVFILKAGLTSPPYQLCHQYLYQLESCWPAVIAGFGKIGAKWGDLSSHTLQGQTLLRRSWKTLALSSKPQSSPYLWVGKLAKTLIIIKECETKLQLVNQQCVVYQFKCNLCDTGSYVGCTHGHLHARVDGHKSISPSVRKHYDNDHTSCAWTSSIVLSKRCFTSNN